MNIPEAVVVTDIDVNGYDDIITLHGGWRRCGIYFGPSFSSEQLVTIPYASSYNPHGLAVGDINSDGMPDIVVADYNNGLVILESTLQPPPFRISGVSVDSANRVTISALYRGGSNHAWNGRGSPLRASPFS